MRTAGIILTGLGALMVLSGINLARTKYNLSDSHDLSVFLGGVAFSVLLLALGISMLMKSGKK